MTKTNACVEKDRLIDYLYGEADAEARTRVEAHLRSCTRCADEVGGLKDIRGTLEAWLPPEAELGFRLVSGAQPEPASVSFWGQLRRPPAWGLATAAVLVLAVGATIARPEVRVGPDGMEIRIGWSEAGPVAATQPGVEVASQSDLATLGAVLRQEMQTLRGTPVAVAPQPQDVLPVRRGVDLPVGRTAVAIDDEGLRSVRQLIRESELRQEDAFDARVQQVEQQIASQRQADLVEMQRAFGEFEVTGEEVVRRRELLDYLMRISAR